MRGEMCLGRILYGMKFLVMIHIVLVWMKPQLMLMDIDEGVGNDEAKVKVDDTTGHAGESGENGEDIAGNAREGDANGNDGENRDGEERQKREESDGSLDMNDSDQLRSPHSDGDNSVVHSTRSDVSDVVFLCTKIPLTIV